MVRSGMFVVKGKDWFLIFLNGAGYRIFFPVDYADQRGYFCKCICDICGK